MRNVLSLSNESRRSLALEIAPGVPQCAGGEIFATEDWGTGDMALSIKRAWTTTAVMALAAALTLTAQAHAAPMPQVAFPQAHSDRKPDPDQVWGRLPNGMSYVLERHDVPPHTAAILMRVGAGSMMETASQRGLAHFVEHMAFEGSTHLKSGELKTTLERKGFRFGADANAVTSDSQTVYILDAPNTAPDTMSTALSSLREIAGNLTFDTDAIDRERGVVLSEERSRTSAERYEAERYNALVYPEQKFGAGFGSAIGSRDIIQSATRDDLTGFYKAWYRPDLVTLVVVGDIDPQAIEAEIKARFADWQPVAPMPDEPDWGTRTPHGIQLFEYTNAALMRRLTLDWIRAPETRPDTLDRHVDNLAESAVAFVLTRRLEAAVQAKDSALLGFHFSRGTAFKTSRTVQLEIDPQPGQTKAAFDQAYGVLKTLMDQGVTDAEVKQVAALLSETRAREVKDFDSRTDRTIANTILSDIAADTVMRGKADTLADMDAEAPQLDKTRLNAVLKTMFSGDGPVLSEYGPSTTDFDLQAFKTEYLAQTKAPAAAYVEAASVAWPYTDFGAPQAPVSHTHDADFGFEHFVFANGVVLNVKPTPFTAGQVEVGVSFLGGLQRLDPKTPRPVPLALGSLFVEGGLGKLDRQALLTALIGKTTAQTLTIDDSVTVLSGATTPVDLNTEMQLLMAYATDPGLRETGFDRFKTALAESGQKQVHASPLKMLDLEFNSVIRPGDWRYDKHIIERLDTVTWPDLSSLYRELLSDTPIVITMVGDVDPQAAANSVAATFGTLPPRPKTAPKAPGADQTPFPPPPGEHVFYHNNGRGDLSVSVAVWPTTGFFTDLHTTYQMNLLAQIIRNRLFDSLREQQGADYSPTATSDMDVDFPKLGYLRVQAQVKAGDDKLFRDTLAAITADLRTHPVSDDELLRVKAPALQAIDNAANTNTYWYWAVAWVGRQPAARAAELQRRADIEATTAADLMALAKTYLRDDTAVFIRVVPQPAATMTVKTAATAGSKTPN